MKKEEVYKRLWKEYEKLITNRLFNEMTVLSKDVFMEQDIEEIRMYWIPNALRNIQRTEEIEAGYHVSFVDGEYDVYYFDSEKPGALQMKERHAKELSALMRRLYAQEMDIEYTMKKLHSKQYLSVKEVAEMYQGMSRSSQETFRSRLHDPLPYHQRVEGGKITYDRDEIEKWRANQHK